MTGPLADDPISETIIYDDFAKIDLRVALIKKAEAVPEAEKQLKLQLDIGSKTRQVFAGMMMPATQLQAMGDIACRVLINSAQCHIEAACKVAPVVTSQP